MPAQEGGGRTTGCPRSAVERGHRLQLRLTSYDFPTHLPGTLRVDPNHPGKLSFDPLPPARNTVRLGGSNPSYLRITALGDAASK